MWAARYARGHRISHMNHSLNSFKGGYIRDHIGDSLGVIRGDTRSLDYSSYMKDTRPKATVGGGNLAPLRDTNQL